MSEMLNATTVSHVGIDHHSIGGESVSSVAEGREAQQVVEQPAAKDHVLHDLHHIPNAAKATVVDDFTTCISTIHGEPDTVSEEQFAPKPLIVSAQQGDGSNQRGDESFHPKAEKQRGTGFNLKSFMKTVDDFINWLVPPRVQKLVKDAGDVVMSHLENLLEAIKGLPLLKKGT